VEAVGLTVLAAVRPDSWNLPLFVHIFGAMLLVGALVLAAMYLFAAWRGDSPDLLRYALRALTLGAFPGYIVLRGSSEWIADKEGWNDVDPAPDWIDLGYIIADAGFVFLVIASLAGWLALRRGVTGGVRVAAVLVALLLVADVIAIWAMTTKPA
jgi:hypothetical protein